MARSVVLQGTHRCERCELPPRWCICAAQRAEACPLHIDVLQHALEAHRPSSTGNLIPRVVEGSRVHPYRRERPLVREEIVRAEASELWILHPNGEELPEIGGGGMSAGAGRPGEITGGTPVPRQGDGAEPTGETPVPQGNVGRKLQVLLLDASWAQAGGMLAQVQDWGRRVRLPMSGKSRYALRAQNGDGRFSTFEALLFLLEARGEAEAARRLRLQFELHVYAGLCSRGRKAEAEAYLAESPVKDAFPELIMEFARKRPNAEAFARAGTKSAARTSPEGSA